MGCSGTKEKQVKINVVCLVGGPGSGKVKNQKSKKINKKI